MVQSEQKLPPHIKMEYMALPEANSKYDISQYVLLPTLQFITWLHNQTMTTVNIRLFLYHIIRAEYNKLVQLYYVRQ